jgi:hypothetical protein
MNPLSIGIVALELSVSLIAAAVVVVIITALSFSLS